jgi:hypothetical protein
MTLGLGRSPRPIIQKVSIRNGEPQLQQHKYTIRRPLTLLNSTNPPKIFSLHPATSLNRGRGRRSANFGSKLKHHQFGRFPFHLPTTRGPSTQLCVIVSIVVHSSAWPTQLFLIFFISTSGFEALEDDIAEPFAPHALTGPHIIHTSPHPYFHISPRLANMLCRTILKSTSDGMTRQS